MPKFAPGPKSLPLIGNVLQAARSGGGHRFFAQLAREYGDVVSFRMGPHPAVFINDPRLISQLVRDRTCLRSSESRRSLGSFLGDGLFSLEGPVHLRHRRLMAPAFHRERIREYGKLMSDHTYRELAGWRPGETRNLTDDLMRLTFTIVSQALFSADTRGDAEAVGKAMEHVIPWGVRAAQFTGLLPDWVPILYPRHVRKSIESLHRLVTRMVADRRREGIDRTDLLSMLLATRDEDGSALSDADIGAEALTLLLAGHDTAANTLLWAMHMLTQNRAVQSELAAEIAAVIGEQPITPDDLPKLPYLEQVVQETLRMYPVAWAGVRVPERDIALGDYHVRAGTKVFFSVYVTQRDPRFYPDPERFDPTRFSPERMRDHAEGAYMPFGAGFHKCIGNVFALTEMKLILAAMIQNFDWHALPEHRVQERPLFVLTMKDAFPVRISERRLTSQPSDPSSALGAAEV